MAWEQIKENRLGWFVAVGFLWLVLIVGGLVQSAL